MLSSKQLPRVHLPCSLLTDQLASAWFAAGAHGRRHIQAGPNQRLQAISGRATWLRSTPSARLQIRVFASEYDMPVCFSAEQSVDRALRVHSDPCWSCYNREEPEFPSARDTCQQIFRPRNAPPTGAWRRELICRLGILGQAFARSATITGFAASRGCLLLPASGQVGLHSTVICRRCCSAMPCARCAPQAGCGIGDIRFLMFSRNGGAIKQIDWPKSASVSLFIPIQFDHWTGPMGLGRLGFRTAGRHADFFFWGGPRFFFDWPPRRGGRDAQVRWRPDVGKL